MLSSLLGTYCSRSEGTSIETCLQQHPITILSCCNNISSTHFISVMSTSNLSLISCIDSWLVTIDSSFILHLLMLYIHRPIVYTFIALLYELLIYRALCIRVNIGYTYTLDHISSDHQPSSHKKSSTPTHCSSSFEIFWFYLRIIPSFSSLAESNSPTDTFLTLCWSTHSHPHLMYLLYLRLQMINVEDLGVFIMHITSLPIDAHSPLLLLLRSYRPVRLLLPANGRHDGTIVPSNDVWMMIIMVVVLTVADR